MFKRYYPKLGKILLISLLLLIFLQCENKEKSVPTVHVYIEFNNQLELLRLQTPFEFLYLTGGWGGIVLYSVDHSQIVAYDLACPHEAPDEIVRVKSRADYPSVLECPKCKTLYSIDSGGWPLDGSGPGTYSLRQYRVTNNGSRIIISN